MIRALIDGVKPLSDFSKYIFFRCLAGSLAFSFAVSFVVGALIGALTLKKDFPFFVIDEDTLKPSIIGVLFIFIWLVLSMMSYLAVQRELDDVYSWLRKKLVGAWNIQLESWHYAENDNWDRCWMIYTADLSIQPKDEKLVAVINQRGHELFEDRDFKTSIVHVEEHAGSYRIVCTFMMKQTVRSEFIATLPTHEYSMTILMVFNLATNAKDAIGSLNGYWYDVDNVMWKIVSELRTDTQAEALFEAFGSGVNSFQGGVRASRIGMTH